MRKSTTYIWSANPKTSMTKELSKWWLSRMNQIWFWKDLRSQERRLKKSRRKWGWQLDMFPKIYRFIFLCCWIMIKYFHILFLITVQSRLQLSFMLWLICSTMFCKIIGRNSLKSICQNPNNLVIQNLNLNPNRKLKMLSLWMKMRQN